MRVQPKRKPMYFMMMQKLLKKSFILKRGFSRSDVEAAAGAASLQWVMRKKWGRAAIRGMAPDHRIVRKMEKERANEKRSSLMVKKKLPWSKKDSIVGRSLDLLDDEGL